MICYLYSAPTYLLFSHDVPALLYYAQIPATIIALLLGFYIFLNGKKILLNRLLFLITILFSLWIFTTLIVWAGNDGGLMAFVWPFYNLILGLIAIFSIYFIYVFLDKKNVLVRIKIIFLTLLAPILILAPTNFNVGGFNITNCDAFDFESLSLKTYASSLGFLAMIWILILLIRKYRTSDSSFKKQVILMGAGIELFLFSFFGMEFVATYLTKTGVLPNSEIEIYGLFGMVIFMIYISILIVKFKTFNIKLIGAQALVWASVILIGSQFFYLQDSSLTVKILTSITLVISSILGLILVRSVKKEDILNEKLLVANDGQKNLIHIMNHQIKGYLGINRNIFAELLTDDYGKVPEEAKDLIMKGKENSEGGVEYVTGILRGDSAESGSLTFDMKPVDFKEIVSVVIEKIKGAIEKKGLKLSVDIANGAYNILGDSIQLGEAVRNLIENSMHYTPSGEISIRLKQAGGKVLLSVKDTGVGIKKEDKDKLFKAGGVGSESIKINVNSSGYGLAFVKGVVEKHKGKVWFESAGAGKGSTFFVELPVK